jgi:tetratricopeptide (TPR) repeat protein
MIRKSEHFEQTDKYLNTELSQPELSEFEAQLAIDSDLAEELNLHLEVEQAIGETDIAGLRENLNKIIRHMPESEKVSVFDSFSFGLSEELSSYHNMDRPVNTNDILNLGLSFPKIHLYQHKVAGKENIHQFYKEQFESEAVNEEESFTSFDEELFSGVQNALEENDIADIRANLKQIARSIPAHHYSVEDIENYISSQMEPELKSQFEEELSLNTALSLDVQLTREIDLASAENDIMQLRASLKEIQKTEFNTTTRIEEIEEYLYNELPEEEMASFEAELSSNLDLVAEINLVKDIDLALKENDIMQLRNSLRNIAGDIAAEKQTERSFVAKINAKRVLVASVAASLVLLLGITGLLSRQSSPGEIYQKFYTTYQTSGVSRSATAEVNQTLATALQKFNSQDYEAALNLLQQVVSSDQNNAAGHFYAGAAFQETGKYSKAISEYETVIINNDNLFTEQAQWYIGLCYIQTNENKKAYKQFKKIAESQGFYQQKAKAVLRKIKQSEE